MLTVFQPGSARYCDGVSRRSFLRAGALALGGLSLGDVLRLRAENPLPGRRREKSAILIFLSGGPSHLDMYDMKPGAPSEYRGEFSPIRTNVPGMDICELMTQQAKIADKFTILRGCQLAQLHSANEFYSGFPWQESPRASVPGEAQRPALGSVVSRLRERGSAMPAYVSLENDPDWERSYYLGVEHEPFRVGGMRLLVGEEEESGKVALENMRRHREISAPRLSTRKGLLRAFDTIARDLDHKGTMRGIDAFQTRALEIVASGKVRDAFDLDQEPQKLRLRYGDGLVKVRQDRITKHPVVHPGRALLQARRLVEAGVSVVTLSLYDWDTHRDNFTVIRELVPSLDQAVHALITDLEERGMLDDVAVLMGGEFGRTPRIGDITPDGRSHWPEAGFFWVAGGGLQTGQVIGATDARGERPVGNPIRMQNVLTTLYRILGIDPATTFLDFNGRPQYVLENRTPVPGLG